jgi:hypothetical protein
MKIPANLTTPRIKLGYGEEVVHSFGTLRRKGIFGNRYGQLHVTNQRVAFVKAVMDGLAASAISKIKSIDKVAHKKQVAIVIADGKRTEKFLVDADEADAAIALFQNAA